MARGRDADLLDEARTEIDMIASDRGSRWGGIPSGTTRSIRGLRMGLAADGEDKTDYFIRLPGHGFAVLERATDLTDAKSYARAVARSSRIRQ